MDYITENGFLLDEFGNYIGKPTQLPNYIQREGYFYTNTSEEKYYDKNE